MTNSLAIGICAALAAALALDAMAFDWTYSLFLARKFTDLLWWMAFWR